MQLLKCGALSINEMIKINADLVKSNVKQLIPCDNLKELVMNDIWRCTIWLTSNPQRREF